MIRTTIPEPAAGPRKRGGNVPDGSREARRVAACVLEVLSGLRSPTEGAAELGVSVARYYQLEQRALAGLLRGCEPPRRGRAAASSRGDVSRLERENERLKRECQRQQALVRLARQAAGLTGTAEPSAPAGKKGRKRKTPRGRRLAEQLRQAAVPARVETQPSGPKDEQPQ